MHDFSELPEEEQGGSALRLEYKLSPTGSILSRQMAKPGTIQEVEPCWRKCVTGQRVLADKASPASWSYWSVRSCHRQSSTSLLPSSPSLHDES